ARRLRRRAGRPGALPAGAGAVGGLPAAAGVASRAGLESRPAVHAAADAAGRRGCDRGPPDLPRPPSGCPADRGRPRVLLDPAGDDAGARAPPRRPRGGRGDGGVRRRCGHRPGHLAVPRAGLCPSDAEAWRPRRGLELLGLQPDFRRGRRASGAWPDRSSPVSTAARGGIGGPGAGAPLGRAGSPPRAAGHVRVSGRARRGRAAARRPQLGGARGVRVRRPRAELPVGARAPRQRPACGRAASGGGADARAARAAARSRGGAPRRRGGDPAPPGRPGLRAAPGRPRAPLRLPGDVRGVGPAR
ncbi:unnamed protein product, partial [Prorocentrum cordatum]